MANVKLQFKVRGSLTAKLRDVLVNKFGKRARNNFADFRPTVEEAIDEGVIDSRHSFIPTNQEAFELGIGEGGSIDTEKTQGAWQQLLVGSSSRSTTFSIRKNPRRNQIGTISVHIDEEALYEAPRSNVEVDDSPFIDSIPWMRWLIEGAPTIPDFEFSSDIPKGIVVSRTGGGIMVQGGLWSFPPANPNAFGGLVQEIERHIGIAVRRDIGRVL